MTQKQLPLVDIVIELTATRDTLHTVKGKCDEVKLALEQLANDFKINVYISRNEPYMAYLVGTTSAKTYLKLFRGRIIYGIDPDYRTDYTAWWEAVPARIPEQFKDIIQSIRLDYGL